MDDLVSTEWLAAEIGAANLRIVDASWHLADAGRDAAAEFAAGHIPGAVFLDLGTLVDTASPVANMLPSAAAFAERVQALGISDTDRVVLYDDSAVKTSARAWFMFRLFGAGSVAILDGGLAKWKSERRERVGGAADLRKAQFTVRADTGAIRSQADMVANLDRRVEQVVDARGPARFAGAEPERAGVTPGHIPGSINLPYPRLFAPDGTFKDRAGIVSAFRDAGVDLARPVTTTCGSGVTAAVLLFALHRVGKTDVALYDGSWTEWGADPATPKASGAA